MKYNSNKEIWYSREELILNPPYLDDFQDYLKDGIGERVAKIKEECHLSLEEMYKSEKGRITSIIEKEYYKRKDKKYSSFITGTTLYNIVTSTNEVLAEKTIPSLPQKITPFWIIFGEENDLHKFMKRIYDNYCLLLLSNKQNSEQAKIIQDLFFADASFSLIYGRAKLENRDINENPNERERKALVDAINYTWSLISGDVLTKFKNSFDTNDMGSPYYLNHSNKYKDQITQWCEEILLPYLNDKRQEIKNDCIAHIGYCVHGLMEVLSKNNIVMNQSDNNMFDILKKNDTYILDCAKNLEKIQRTYFDELRDIELKESIANELEKSGDDYELEGDLYEIGTGKIISFDDSGKTFDKLIDEAVKYLWK